MKVNSTIILLLIVSSHAISQNWERATDIPQTNIWSVVNHYGILFAGSDSTIYKSTDGGSSWIQSLSHLSAGKAINVLFSTHDKLFAGTAGDGVYVSNDSGTSWKRTGNILGGWSADIVELTSLGDSLYAGTNGAGIYVLGFSDTADWSEYNQGLPQFQTEAITASGNALIAAMSTDVFIRRQGESSWSDIRLDTTVWQRTALQFLVTEEYVFAGTSVGIYRGDRDGQHWVKLQIPTFPNLPVETFALQGTRIYAGVHYHNEFFVITSDDWGTTWTPRSHEFAVLLDLLASGDRLWAARTDGLWWFPLATWLDVKSGRPDIPSAMHLYQNYPNPFNPVTSIEFELPARAFTKLQVFDLSGKKIASLMEQTLDAGSHHVMFNGKNLASGTYFYRLQSGTYIQTKKLTLLR